MGWWSRQATFSNFEMESAQSQQFKQRLCQSEKIHEKLWANNNHQQPFWALCITSTCAWICLNHADPCGHTAEILGQGRTGHCSRFGESLEGHRHWGAAVQPEILPQLQLVRGCIVSRSLWSQGNGIPWDVITGYHWWIIGHGWPS